VNILTFEDLGYFTKITSGKFHLFSSVALGAVAAKKFVLRIGFASTKFRFVTLTSIR
jgi:hypothetical protein